MSTFTRNQIATGARQFDQLQDDRRAKLQLLLKDKVFLRLTDVMEHDLNELHRRAPSTYKIFFDNFTYQTIFDASRVRKLLSEVKNLKDRKTLKKYIRYCSRFQVVLRRRKKGSRRRKKRSLYPVAMPPFKKKFRVAIVNGRCRHINQEVRAEEEVVITDLYESSALFPLELEKMIESGYAIAVKVADESGGSVLHELESFAYDPRVLTFILHEGIQKYLFCLVGERMSTDKIWRPAGKVVTALQKEFYGRQKAGHPTNIAKFADALEIRGQGRPLKVAAAERASSGLAKEVATNQSYISRAGKSTGIPRKASNKR